MARPFAVETGGGNAIIWGKSAESAEFLREGAPFLMVPARKRPFASVVASLKWLPGRWVPGSEGAVRVTVTGSKKRNPALAAATAPPDERGAKLPAGTPIATVRLSFVARSVRWIGPSGMSTHQSTLSSASQDGDSPIPDRTGATYSISTLIDATLHCRSAARRALRLLGRWTLRQREFPSRHPVFLSTGECRRSVCHALRRHSRRSHASHGSSFRYRVRQQPSGIGRTAPGDARGRRFQDAVTGLREWLPVPGSYMRRYARGEFLRGCCPCLESNLGEQPDLAGALRFGQLATLDWSVLDANEGCGAVVRPISQRGSDAWRCQHGSAMSVSGG